jgi:hypothetical protein
MARQLTYQDALRILGTGDSKTLRAIDKLLGGAILAATATTGHLEIASLLHVRDQLVNGGQKLLANFGERVRGANGKSRTDLLVAAHAVIAINAYFVSLKAASLSINADDLKLTKKDELHLAGASSSINSSRKLVDALISLPVPLPGAHLPFEQASAKMGQRYEQVSEGLLTFVTGLAVWDTLDDTKRSAFIKGVRELPEFARNRYEDFYLRLSADCIEFQIWADAVDNAATRYVIQRLGSEVNRSLSGLALELGHLSAESAYRAGTRRLSGAYKAQLRKPIVEATPGEAHAGLSVPLMEDAYINPACLVAECGPQSSPAEESWWQQATHWEDVQWFLASYLTSPMATQSPLVVLGQPGSGKSLLTKILAARLPEDEFMPVRVELRRVHGDASLDGQIEAAVLQATGERLEWVQLVREAGNALPVLMLDGFDELLQGTGVSHSDYLERVQEFQRRELDNDRRVAVLVTSRTVVADRVRFPEGSVGVKLESFSEQQIDRWLNEWNHVNSNYFRDAGLQPLRAATVMRHLALAQQPLLLMMLAFYDADGNLLQRQSGQIHQAELYEQLLDKFVRREIAKLNPSASKEELQEAITLELTQLAVAGLAMFNRGRQSATEEEIDADLIALIGDISRSDYNESSLGRRLPPARLVVGRFFFIHESQANVDATRFATYEFLHATFGEYLVAWIIFVTLQRIVVVKTAERDVISFSAADSVSDERLYTLLSFALLSDRIQVAIFLKELMARTPLSHHSQLRLVLEQLFQGAAMAPHGIQYGGYKPRSLSISARYSLYRANLLILNVLASDDALPISKLFGLDSPLDAWQRLVLLWQSQLESSGLDGLLKTLRIERVIGESAARDLMVSFSSSMDLPKDIDAFRDLSWSLYGQIPDDEPGITDLSAKVDRLVKMARFMCADDLDLLLHGLYPLLDSAQRGVGLVMSSPGANPTVSAANVVLSMLYEQLEEVSQEHIDQVLHPWRALLRQADFRETPTIALSGLSGSSRWSNISTIVNTNFVQTGLGSQRVVALSGNSVAESAPIGYWATVINALAGNYFTGIETGDQVSSQEFVKNALGHVDIVRLARDEPEAALNALKIARRHELFEWSADQGLSILTLMPKEQLAVVPEEEVVFVLAWAARNGATGATIDVVRSRWLSAGGVAEPT